MSKLIVVDIFIKETEVIFKSLKETYGVQPPKEAYAF